MRIALLSGACPGTATQMPRVRLQAGSWRFDVDGRVDSDLILHIKAQDYQHEIHKSLTLLTGETVEIGFVKRGTERFISVFAEKVA